VVIDIKVFTFSNGIYKALVMSVSRHRVLTDEEVTALLMKETFDEETSPSSSSTSDVVIEEEEDDIPYALRLLELIPVDTNYANGFDLEIKGNIDSILVCCRTLEPFLCKYSCDLYFKPNIPKLVKNTKFTKYMDKRSEFCPTYKSRFVCRNENEDHGD